MGLFQILVDISASTARFTSGVESVERRLDQFGEKVQHVGEVLAGGAFAEMVKHTIDVGAELQRASIRAGTTAEAFSELAYAAKLQGVGTNERSAAMVKMNKAISEASTGAQKPAQAFAALGLTFKDLKALSPDQQFELIAQRISELQSPADKSRALIALFGKAGAELGPLFERGAAGIREAREEAERMGQSFSAETLHNLEEAHKSIQRLESSFSALATTLTAKAAPAISGMLDNISALVSGDKLGKLHAEIDFLQRNAGHAFLALGLQDIQSGFYSAAAGAQLLLELQQKLRNQQPATSRHAPSIDPDLQKMLDEAQAPGFAATQEELDKLQEVHLNIRKEYLWEFYKKLDELSQTDVEKTLEAYAEKQGALEELYQQGIVSTQEYATRSAEILDKTLQPIQITAHYKFMKQIKEDYTEMERLADQAAQRIEASFTDFLINPTVKGFQGMLKAWVDTLERMVAEALAKDVFKALFKGAEGSAGGGLGDILGGLLTTGIGAYFGGGPDVALADSEAGAAADQLEGSTGFHFAAGGRPPLGQPSLVGEKGPELFVPDSAGSILPNSVFGGGGGSPTFNITHNIDARGADAERIMTIMPTLLAQVRAATKRDILSAFERGGYAAPRTA